MDLNTLSTPDLAALDHKDVKAALRSAFAGLATGTSVQPSQTVTVFPGDAGDAIFYPGALLDAGIIGVKISPYLASLARAGQSPVTAFTLLLSAETGQPVLLCDSLALTTVRTAATTSLALDYLIPDDAKRLTIIGSGPVATTHLDYVAHQHPWEHISIYSPALADPAHTMHANRRSAIDALGLDVTVSNSAAQAAEGADVILLCTSSGKPVLDSEHITNAKVVTSISTNVPGAHEIDPKILTDLDVYCDYRLTAPTTAGDLILAADHGWTADAVVADLPELITGAAARTLTSGTRYFRSTGLGVEDLAIASLFLA